MPRHTDKPVLGTRFDRALALATELHQRQLRKDAAGTPYVGHLMVVAGTVLEHEGTEDEAIAALLHDAVEDCGGRPVLARIRAEFGERVAAIVEGCSDSLAEDGTLKEEWKKRKERYLAHLVGAEEPVRLVSAADKLHNFRGIARHYRQHGEAVWSNFNAGKDLQLWFFSAFAKALRESTVSARLEPLVEAVEEVVDDIKLLATRGSVAHALAISATVHGNQRDKAGAPYALHPIRMMLRMDTDEEKIVALLHDVVEDGVGWSFERLRRGGFSESVIAALDGVTKREGENYDDFVRRAARNPVSRRVKRADLEDNMNLLRLGELSDKDVDRLRRYHRSWRALGPSR